MRTFLLTMDLIPVALFLMLVLTVVSFAGAWLVQGNDFFMYKFFAPRQEAVRREVFENTKSYRQGVAEELENMRFDYEKADPEHKAALASIIRHRAADIDETTLTPDMAVFLRGLHNTPAYSTNKKDNR